MHVSTWILLGIIELFLVMMALCLFLLIHSRKLKQLSVNLQNRVKKLVTDLKQARAEAKQYQDQLDPVSLFKKHVNDQIQLTRDYHDTLHPDQDIALDLDNNVPLERQTVAFRHAVLIAEKEAIHSSDDASPNWAVLKSKFSQLMDYYRNVSGNTPAEPEPAPDADDSELEVYKKRVESLEKFKQLYFDLEKQWEAAQAEASEYHALLSSYAPSFEDQEGFEAALLNYSGAFDNFGGMLQNLQQPPEISVIEKTRVVHATDNAERAHMSELDRLRNVAVDQHRTINSLKRRLADSNGTEKFQEIVVDLQSELDKQARFVKEAETCVQLLEDELESANTRIAHLEKKASQKEKSLGDYTRLERELEQSRGDVKQLEQVKKSLENEISQLEALFETAGSSNEELKKLRADYAQLEERYLALKMK